MERFTPFANGMTEDPEGDWVRYEDALLYGSEQFGLGRLDGQADAKATRQPFTKESILAAMKRAEPGCRELAKQQREDHLKGLNQSLNLRLD